MSVQIEEKSTENKLLDNGEFSFWSDTASSPNIDGFRMRTNIAGPEKGKSSYFILFSSPGFLHRLNHGLNILSKNGELLCII